MTDIPKIEPKKAIIIAGLEQAGKTCFVQRLITGQFSETKPTLGLKSQIYKYLERSIVISDLAGQESFRTHIWEKFISSAYALIYVFDAADLEKLDESVKWFWKALSFIKHKHAPILFVLSKWDLIEEEDRDKRIEMVVESFKFDEVTKESKQRSFKFFPTSAKDGTNVYISVNWLMNKINDIA